MLEKRLSTMVGYDRHTAIGTNVSIKPIIAKEEPGRVKWRWVALFLCLSIIMGPYFAIDNPAELEWYIEDTYDITTDKYALLYSLYALPNMILPLFGGIILDKIGLHNGLLITSTFVTVGQFICAIGGFIGSFNIILGGRIIFGMGCETLWCVQAAFVGKWFFDQEISFAIGFGYAIPNLCAFGAGWWVPGIAADPNDPTGYATRDNGKGIGYAMGTSALVCSYSWLAGILLIILDKKINQIDERKAV